VADYNASFLAVSFRPTACGLRWAERLQKMRALGL
jgi:hypothetical protein